MPSQSEEFTIGVEEEYQILDPETRELIPRAGRILPAARRDVGEEVQSELYLSQIEIGTPICRTLADVRSHLVRLRRAVSEAAARDGNRIAAAGTHPFSHWQDQPLTPKPRYFSLAEDYKQLAREQVIFGCHIHVGIADRDLAIGVMNRARLWAAPLLALSASSPFWLGMDTGFVSYRTEIWRRWPTSGLPQEFASAADYDALVHCMISVGAVEEASKIYWDLRPSSHVPTLEFRIADVCTTIDEAVLQAALVRALARTCRDEIARGEPANLPRYEILEAARWAAARHGFTGDLIDARLPRSVPGRRLVEGFLQHLRPVLEDLGEWDEVSDLARRVLRDGSAADRQREVYEKTRSLEAVVDHLIAETERGIR